MSRPWLELPRATGSDRGFRRAIELLIWLVLLPTIVLLVLAILLLAWSQPGLRPVFVVLIATLVGCLITGAVLAMIVLQREARVSRLQLDFLSKVSHELRTPLTSITMFAETLQSGSVKDPDQVRLCLETIQREAARLQEQIERLLDWGRMQAGRRVYVREPEPVERLVTEAVEAARPMADSRGQLISAQIAPALPCVDVDQAAMVGAILNLLTNASKYSDDGATIEIGAGARDHCVRIWVRDHGIGIPRGEHRNIFRQFYRVDDRLSRTVEGSGLGLAIVRHVVRGHDGQVELESEPGKGSTFTLVLPAAKGT